MKFKGILENVHLKCSTKHSGGDWSRVDERSADKKYNLRMVHKLKVWKNLRNQEILTQRPGGGGGEKSDF